MGNLGGPELLIIVLLIVIFFGAKKIPEIAQGMGKGIREFRKAAREIQSEDEPPQQIAGAKDESTVCMHCGGRIPKNVKFCPTCGKSQEAPTCAKCGTVNVPANKFCSECGEKL